MPTAAACPDMSELDSFARGEKTPAEIEQVAEHLENCSRCAETVDQLLASETLGNLVVAVRAQKAISEHAAPPVSALIDKLCALQPGLDLSSGTLNQSAEATPSPDAGADDRLDFLVPAQSADELGRLGSYRVFKVLGAGGMGMVFHAEDVQLKRPVALKVMRPSLAAAGGRGAFLASASGRGTATRPHRHDLPGGRRPRRALSGHGTARRPVPRSMAQTLSAAASRQPAEHCPPNSRRPRGRSPRGLIHRDIKPSNIWLESVRQPPGGKSSHTDTLEAPSNAPRQDSRFWPGGRAGDEAHLHRQRRHRRHSRLHGSGTGATSPSIAVPTCLAWAASSTR